MIEAQCADRADSGADYVAQVLLWFTTVPLSAHSGTRRYRAVHGGVQSGTAVPLSGTQRYTA
eukprot:scaffold160946_cov23-Cyclotella_meneghiniana.AAC.1